MPDSTDTPPADPLLGGLGVTPAEEAVYRALLRHGPGTLAALGQVVGSSVTALRRLLPRLEDLGLVTRLPGRPLRLIATSPQVALDDLAARRQQEIAHSRAAAALLAEEAVDRTGPHPEELLEVVTGTVAVARRYQHIERSAREEFLVLVHPPYAVDVLEPAQSTGPGSRAKVRGIYGPQAFDAPGMLEHTRKAVADGEEARLGPVPIKLAIADRHTAILPLGSDHEHAVDSALVVHPSALLDALVALFEVLWSMAVPLPAQEVESGPVDAPDADVLALLATGMKDEAIARQLGVSLRTVQRRVREVCERLSARTRYQAGMLAARLGKPEP